MTKLPFDHHMVMGLVAPRALLVIDNQIDWLGIDSTYTAGSIAHAIWEAFGLADHMGYWQTGGHMPLRVPVRAARRPGSLREEVPRRRGQRRHHVLRADAANADLDSLDGVDATDLAVAVSDDASPSAYSGVGVERVARVRSVHVGCAERRG